MPTDASIRATILEALADLAPEVDPADLDPTAPLRDEADLDSLDVLRLIGRLEEELGTAIPPERHAEQASLDELVAVLAADLGER